MLPAFVYRSEAFAEDLDDHGIGRGAVAPWAGTAPPSGLPRWATVVLLALGLLTLASEALWQAGGLPLA